MARPDNFILRLASARPSARVAGSWKEFVHMMFSAGRLAQGRSFLRRSAGVLNPRPVS